jgi:hypothetical protein
MTPASVVRVWGNHNFSPALPGSIAGDKSVDKAVDKPVGNAGDMTQPTVMTDHVCGYRRAKVTPAHVGRPRMFHVKRSIDTKGPMCSCALGG